MTTAEIVQRLLNEGKITAEEAVVLLTPIIVKDVEYVPYNPWQPIGAPTYKTYPLDPPYTISCNSGGTQKLGNLPKTFTD